LFNRTILTIDDTAADFQKLYREYYSALVVYAMSFEIHKIEAEDIVQDLFIHIWENEIEVDFSPAFNSFLYKSIKHRCLNHLKHQDVVDKYADFVHENAEDNADMGQEIDEREIYRQLSLAIDELPDKCKQIFEMHLSGKRNDEIAELLNISIETVKTQKKRAVRKIKDKMNPLFFISILPFILR
jgi:RNA polymerase sigma-70 factor (ECF subfamily)